MTANHSIAPTFAQRTSPPDPQELRFDRGHCVDIAQYASLSGTLGLVSNAEACGRQGSGRSPVGLILTA